MLYLACTTISSVDLAQYGVSLAKDWVSVECGTSEYKLYPGMKFITILSSSFKFRSVLFLLQPPF